jgi:hypothetical protein
MGQIPITYALLIAERACGLQIAHDIKRGMVDITLRYSKCAHAFIKEPCGPWPSRHEILKRLGADAQICCDQSYLLVIKGAQLFLPSPPIANSAK